MADLDDLIRAHCENAEYDPATTLLLRQLGPSIFRYLAARARDENLASDAFAAFAEDVWRGMRGFAGRSSVRVWAFTVARNALGQLLRKTNRERRRTSAWDSTLVGRVAVQVRTETLVYLKTEMKQRFAELRQRLSPDEQGLLVLRVNECLGWDDIARIQLDPLKEPDVKREAARLRKRFQLVREKLHRMAKAEGLVDDKDDP